MAIKDWSTTPASNDTVTDATYGDINWVENQAPNTVNNSSRSEMAHVRAFYENIEWRDYGHTVTRTGNTTFEISGDYSADYVVKRRIKCTDASTIYATITDVDYNVTKASFTTVTVATDSGNLSATLSAVALGPSPENAPYPMYYMSGDGVLAPHKNLIVKNNAGTPNTQMDVDFDEILLTDGVTFLRIDSGDYTIDTAGTGLNGLDTGTLGTDVYYIWVVSDGTTTGAVASTSSTWAGVDASITGTYTYYGLAGANYAGTGTFATVYQENNKAYRPNLAVTSTGAATSFTVQTSATIPELATSLTLGIELYHASASANVRCDIAPDSAGTYTFSVGGYSASTGRVWGVVDVPLITAQTYYYLVDDATRRVNISVIGWEY